MTARYRHFCQIADLTDSATFLTQIRHQLHQHPELSFKEAATAELVAGYLGLCRGARCRRPRRGGHAQAQQCGFTLSEVHALLELRDDVSSCCNDVRDKAIEKRRELEARVLTMQAMVEALDRLIAECRNDTRPAQNCAILASLSCVAKSV